MVQLKMEMLDGMLYIYITYSKNVINCMLNILKFLLSLNFA